MTVKVESIIRISLPKYTIRVWRFEEDQYEHVTQGVTDVECVAHECQDLHPKALGLKLMLMERVSAVEILDWNQNGIVYYQAYQ